MTCLDSQSHGGQGLRCTFPGTGGVINPQQCDGGRDLRDAQSGSRLPRWIYGTPKVDPGCVLLPSPTVTPHLARLPAVGV